MASRNNEKPEYDPLVEDARFDRDELGLDPEEEEELWENDQEEDEEEEEL